ncbi:recombinase family protein [Microbacterium sp. KSW4-17]|uniref:Recombinase family protein n=1 Tax=Microbacterium galbum TaxID=3075994 RepID=A0ABU3T8S2_9MICO|nr:recombinase family protein [Microbacterium sp. KSW4-17]MDU0367665.1 recombinase family protein [Microbacterium sp. KSW4-17]
MTTCAIYVRQSMDKATGIDRQLVRCRALAASRGWDVVAEFEDNAVSAYKTRGSGSAWSKLLASDAEVIVSVNLDRLLRGQADLLTIIVTGKTVATVEGDLDLTTADGRFRAELLTSLATFETNRKRERHIRANESRVASGLPVPGKRRYGFEPGNVVEREAEADVIRKAYADLLAGRSLRSIAAEWGRPPARVRTVLINPSYAGWVQRRGQLFEAAPEVARIVDRETWQAAQDLLMDESRRVGPGPKPRHLLTTIARCECGERMHSASRYYKCATGEPHSTIDRVTLDNYVKARLAIILTEDAGTPAVGEVGPLASRLRELEDERSRWTTVAALPGADMAQATRELARIASEAEKASRELGTARVAGHHAALIDDVMAAIQETLARGEDEDGILDLDLGEFTHYFDALDLDLRRGLVESKVTVTVAHGGKVTVAAR